MSDHLEYNIGVIPFQDDKWSCGIAYICIPKDIDRDIFIADCFLKGTVMIKSQDGGVYKNCPINKSTFNDIIWPDKYTENGTAVVYITEPIHKQPIVVASLIFNNEIVDQTEQQFKLKRHFKNSVVEISGSAQDEYLTILVEGDKKSDFLIKLSNKNNDAILNIDIDGYYNLLAVNDINIASQSQIINKVGYGDKSTKITQDATEINNRANKFSINDGSQAMILGNIFKNLFDDFIDTVAQSTVTTRIGQMPLLNATQIAAFKAKTAQILSDISFTD